MKCPIKLFRLFFLFCVLGPLNINAQTIQVSDTIKINTTWNADTVKVIEDVTINKDIILVIEPGTYIEFQGHFELTVLGTIQAIGTSDQPITFTVNDTSGFYDLGTKSGGWNGIRFNETGFTSHETMLKHCIFEYGKATDGNPGIEVPDDYGGAIYLYNCYEDVIIDSCIIRNCQAKWNGGAICLRSAYNTVIKNCIITDNKSYNGGAIYSSQTYGLKVFGCFINNNTAEYGGAIRLGTSEGYFVNNVISNNESQYWGGGIYAIQGWDIKLANNTIVNNRATRGGGIYIFENLYPHSLVNNIFWGNMADTDSQIYVNTQTVKIDFCDIQGWSFGENNLDKDPLFKSPTDVAGLVPDGSQPDWSLQSSSPCINAGNPEYTIDSLGISVDIAGKPRILNNIIEMGAYEISPEYNMAVRFKKEGGIVQIPHAEELSPDRITIECWINKDTVLGYEYTLLDKRGNSSGYNLRLAGERFPLSAHFVLEGSGGDAAVSSPEIFNLGSWNHIAATYNGSILSMYVNGKLVDTAEASMDISLSQSPLFVGDYLGYPGSSLYFGGDMDELRIWNYARTKEELVNHMHDTLSGEEPGLVGYWPFNEYTGLTAHDQSNHGNDGLLGPEACFVRSGAPVGFIPPDPPVGLRASGNDNSIDLRWKHQDEGVHEIHIYRGSTKDFQIDPSSLLVKVSSLDSTYQDTDVSPGALYFYSIIAVDSQMHESQAGSIAVSRTVSLVDEFITGVYYYPWYKDESVFWRDYIRNYTIPRQPPMLGHYASNDVEVVQQHLNWMEAYGIDFMVSSWGGEEFAEDPVLKEVILPLILNSPLKFSIYYESAKLTDENWNIIIDSANEAELLDDIIYLADNYFDHPNYLRVDDKPVLFIYLSGIYQGDYLNAFERIRNTLMTRGHDLFIVGDEGSWGEFFPNHIQFLDALSPYAVLPQPYHGEYVMNGSYFADFSMLAYEMEKISHSQGKLMIPNVNPGFNSNALAPYVFPRQIAPWANLTSLLEENIKLMRPFTDPQQRMIMITSWNEWYEDTQIEPTIITVATNQDNSGSGNQYTGGYIYQGYGFDYLEVVDELLSDGISNVSNRGPSLEINNESFTVFPNPSNGYIIIKGVFDQIITSIDIFSLTGVSLKSYIVDNKSFTIQTDEFTPGIYIVEIRTPVTKIVKKVIIE